MRFKYNAGEAEPLGDFEPVPKGPYALVIESVGEKATKDGVPMANVQLAVIDNPKYKGRKVWLNVIFWQNGEPGTGYTLHFLKCIGQPHKGNFDINTEKWIGKKVKSYLTIEEYKGKENNKISQLMPYDASNDGFGDTAEVVEEESPL